jgi:hypothetical protein
MLGLRLYPSPTLACGYLKSYNVTMGHIQDSFNHYLYITTLEEELHIHSEIGVHKDFCSFNIP